MSANLHRRFLFGLVPAIFLVLVWIAPAGSQTENSEEKKRYEAAESEERRILIELDELELELGRFEDQLVSTERDMDEVRQRLENGGREIGRIQQRSQELRKYLAVRLKAIYRLRDGGMFQLLLEAESIPDLVKRYRYLSIILDRDDRVLREFGDQARILLIKQSGLQADQTELNALKADLAAQKKKLMEVRRKKTALLMKVHQRKEFYLAVIRSREESHERLIKEVIVLPEGTRERRPAEEAVAPTEAKAVESSSTKTSKKEAPKEWPDFTKYKGRIPRPVSGKIVKRFGRARGPFNTVTTRHGLIFRAGAGSEVKAVLDGEVLYAGWLKGYGHIIIVNHGDRYYTLTGGLVGMKHKAGEWVRRGEVIGLAPKGGKKEKKDIYFEIRHRGQAIDPARWLGKKPAA